MKVSSMSYLFVKFLLMSFFHPFHYTNNVTCIMIKTKHGIWKWKLIELKFFYIFIYGTTWNSWKAFKTDLKNHCRFIEFGIIKHKTYIILPIISCRFFPFKIYWFYDEWHLSPFHIFLSIVNRVEPIKPKKRNKVADTGYYT